MNVTSFKITNATDNVTDPLFTVELFTKQMAFGQSYQIRNATGLDAESITKKPGGSWFIGNDSFVPLLGPRTMVFDVSLNPNYSIGETESSLRDTLYRAIAFNRPGLLTIHFMNGTDSVAETDVSVVKFEHNLFSSDSDVQLTFESTYPFLRSSALPDEMITVDTSSGFLEEPFEIIGSFTDDVSTAPHGFYFQLGTIDFRTIGSARIDMIDLNGVEYPFEIDFPDIADAHSITVSSEFDNKYVKVVVGHDIHTLDSIDATDLITSYSEWPVMYPGINRMRIGSVGVVETLQYRHSFWGV